jgi:hypothetical protein
MQCLVPGCANDARNRLSIRCRKPSTRAVWSPDADAFLCKAHAENGVEISIDIAPVSNGQVKATYFSGGQAGPSRTTPIRKSAA